ncbi:oligo-1,6-glucosidase [Enterococcus sp. 665A]|uniref:Alpha-amylase n=2 Tax=Candidatus Enterococcus ferrettii TaxID=2815324 RepID=A0ABV0EQP6_9ENTE
MVLLKDDEKMVIQNKKWWHEAIGYQIYPKSFQDTNNDGIGDIPGMIEHLDDLSDLGINVIWISPINLSPMVDHGYDISDYLQIDPSFGTNEEFERLIQEAEKRGIKVLMDLVINHTSSQHEWFKRAMADLDSKYADYYVIREGRGEEPPNNWRSMFGGSAWEKIPGTNKYYLHLFTVDQPDLNWENPELRQELYEIIEFWLTKGLAGFRVDAISHIKKIYDEENLPSDGPDGLVTVWENYRDALGIGEFLGELRDRVFSKQDILTIAEMDVVDPEKWEEYFGDNGYFSSIFDFYHTAYSIQGKEFANDSEKFIEFLKPLVYKKQELANDRVFFTNFIENHDLPRSLNRFIPKEEIGFHSASVLGMFYFFMRGIPVIYQGQEIGMVDYPKETIDGYIDLATHNNYQDYLLNGLSETEALAQINIENRENSRTPMQWNSQTNAGFTKGTPWFAVNPTYHGLNYQQQKEDPHSLLSFYKEMIQLRKNPIYKELLVYGRAVPGFVEASGVVTYQRKLEKQTISALCNLTNQTIAVDYDAKFEVLLNNYAELDCKTGQLTLLPYQGVILEETSSVNGK